MSDSKFTTHGDEPVEARIVAWVLGEASAFEAEELERLCEERPELAVFKRRIEAVHGLAKEAHDTKDDARWKLSIQKRAAIDELIGAEEEAAEDLAREERAGQSGRRAMMAIAACLVMTLVVATLTWPIVFNQTKSAANYGAESEQAYLWEDSTISGEVFDMERVVPKETVSKKPSEPSSNVSRVITSAEVDALAIPVPEAEVTKPSVHFGANGNFGEGWGASGDGGGGEKRLKAKGGPVPVPDEVALNTPNFQASPLPPGQPEVKASYTFAETESMRRGRLTRENNTPGLDAFKEQKGNHNKDVAGFDGLSRDKAEESGSITNHFYANEKLAEGYSRLHPADPAPAGEPSPVTRPAPATPSAPPMVGGRDFNGLRSEGVDTPDDQGQGQGEGRGRPSRGPSDVDYKYRETEKGLLGKQLQTGTGKPDPTGLGPKGDKESQNVDDFLGYSAPAKKGRTDELNKITGGLSHADGIDVQDRIEEGKKMLAQRKLVEATEIEIDDTKPAEESVEERERKRTAWWVGDESEKTRIDQDSAFNANSDTPRAWLNSLSSSLDEPVVDPKQVDITTKAIELDQKNGKELGFDWALENQEGQPKSGNLSELAKREVIRRQSDVVEGDILLQDGRRAYEDGNYEIAAAKYRAALQLVPDAPLFAERRGVYQNHLKDAEKALAKLAPEDKDEDRKRPVVTDEETIAAEEPYSTFSLNINDASFRVAQAALAKGELPDPTGIKVEQFYNAVDYGDPAPAQGQPVAGTIEQTAHPVIPGRNLVRVAIKTASEGRNQGQPLRLTLLIDQSGSMAREDRRQAMLDALEGLRGLLKDNDQVNVIGFSRTPRLLAEAVNGKQGQLADLLNVEANEGGTNLEEALKLGEQLAERHQLEGAQNRMVLFTDGAANLGDADPDSLSDKIKELRQKGIAFDIAGIVADGLNDELLGEMARHGNGRYYVVGKGGKNRFAEQLAGAFQPAAENVKVQVHFNPERVGRYKLIGFEKDRLNKEDFHDDTVDAAELAAEEAGVAIYQVETLPEGKGEIGEVSVRFRDVASGNMVERSWTIANEISTAALDQAQPSMQLATLAMMAGEKLRGGPMADAINFNEMGEVIAKVNQHYKGDPKAAEVLEMIEQLK